MPDLSSLDKKYFVDRNRYNCPFCNRGSVKYLVTGEFFFDWSDNERRYGYFVECQETDCEKRSLHLSRYPLDVHSGKFYLPSAYKIKGWEKKIDDLMFFSHPTSFFTLDKRIPREVRELIKEARSSLKMNLLVGASATLRKAIYETIRHEKSAIKSEKTGLTDYKKSIKKLKQKFPWVQPELFDALSGVQEMASDIVHEESWEEWDSGKLKILLELTRAVLHEMYVMPEEKKQRAGVVTELKELFTKKSSSS